MVRALKWLASFETGVEDIDADHRAIFALLQKTDQAMKCDDLLAVSTTMQNLLVEFEEHFAREVRVLKALDYPEAEQHEQEHRDMICELRALQVRCAGKPDSVTLCGEIESAFTLMLRDILHSDVHFKSYLQDKAGLFPRQYS